MENLSLSPPHDFHHRRHGKSPHHFHHQHLQTVTDNGGHMYGHGRKHGHGRGGHHMRRGKGEGEDLVFDGEQKGKEWKGGRGRGGCHGCDKRHGGHHGRSPVLHVPAEAAGQKEFLTAVKEAAGEKESSTPFEVTKDVAEPAVTVTVVVDTDCRHGCHRGHGRHGFHGGKDKGFFGSDGGHWKHKFGKERKTDKCHNHEKRNHKHEKRNAPLDVIMSTDTYTLLMDAPGATIGDVSVTSSDGILTIRVERKFREETEGDRVLVRERMVGSRVRQVALPTDAVLEAASSEIAEGVLTVAVPRRPQGVEVRVNAEGSIRTEEGIYTEDKVGAEVPRGESGVDTEMADGVKSPETV